MNEYEYLVEVANFRAEEPQILSLRGKEGWDLCAVVLVPRFTNVPATHYYFKRKVENATRS